MLDRRRQVIFVTAGVVFLLAVLICVFTTRKYTAASVIELQKMSASSPSLDSLMGGDTAAASDAMALNVDLQTQADILLSDALALRVIKELNLEGNPDFKQHFNPVGWVSGSGLAGRAFGPRQCFPGSFSHAPAPGAPRSSTRTSLSE